jgi:hypothetical protein
MSAWIPTTLAIVTLDVTTAASSNAGVALGKIHAIVSIPWRYSILERFLRSPSKSSLKRVQPNNTSSRPTCRQQLPIPARPLGRVWAEERRLSDIGGHWTEATIPAVYFDK